MKTVTHLFPENIGPKITYNNKTKASLATIILAPKKYIFLFTHLCDISICQEKRIPGEK